MATWCRTDDTARGLPATGASLPALLKKNGLRDWLIGNGILVKAGIRSEWHGFDEFFGF